LRCLITQYGESNDESAGRIVEMLQTDYDSMFKHLMTLRTDVYPTTSAYDSVRPAQIVTMPSDKNAFLYASKRYMIPFGWFANPLPSTASTSWAVMLHYNFNPLGPRGDYEAFLKP
jgi:hypothetical protein